MVIDVVFALRSTSPSDAILYRIGLTSPARAYEQDKAVLERLVKGFRLIPVAP